MAKFKGSKRKRSYRKRLNGRRWGPMAQQRTRAPEVKAVDIAETSVACTSTAGSVLLNALSTGVESYQRLGSQIAMQSIHLRGWLSMTGNAALVDFLRICVVYDRQPDGTSAVFNDVFSTIDSTGTVGHSTTAFQDLSNLDRFSVLADYQFPIVPATAASFAPSFLQDQDQPIYINKKIYLKGLISRYQKAATTPQSGALYLFYYGIHAAGTSQANLIFTSRMTFTDP